MSSFLHKNKYTIDEVVQYITHKDDVSHMSLDRKAGLLAATLVVTLEELERLKGPQKPLPLEEFFPGGVERFPDVVWIEFKGEHIIDVWTPRNSGEDFILWYCQIDEKDQYNKTWRCWLSKPTDEERRAAEWEE